MQRMWIWCCWSSTKSTSVASRSLVRAICPSGQTGLNGSKTVCQGRRYRRRYWPGDDPLAAAEGAACDVSSDISGLTAMLTGWLPGQRWYPAGHPPTGAPMIIADVLLDAGDPELRHLVVDVPDATGLARYHVPVGLASDAPDVPERAVIGKLPDGLIAYDALHDQRLHAVLLTAIASQRTAGDLRFGTQPGARLADWPSSRLVTA